MNLTFEQLLPSSQSTEIQKSSYRWSIVSIYAYNVWQWLENFWKPDFWGKAKNILFLFFFFLRGVYLDFHLLTITEFEVSFQKPEPKTIRYHNLQKVWRWLPWFEKLRIFVLMSHLSGQLWGIVIMRYNHQTIMKRSRLKSKFLKDRNETHLKDFKLKGVFIKSFWDLQK